jgi:tetratricopeptide (TPR) repeat protein
LSTALSIVAESKDAPTLSLRKAKTARAEECHQLLGRVLMMGGKPDQAVVELQNMLRAVPGFFSIEDQLKLINLLAARGRFRDAVADCRKVLETDPQNALARNQLAWMLATCPDASVRDGAKAVEIARLLVQDSRRREPAFLDTLAAAYAEAGQFPKAVATAKEALALAQSAKQTLPALTIQSHLDLYRAGRPYRQTPPGAGP